MPDVGQDLARMQQLKGERRHALWKAGVALCAAALLTIFVIWPGWTTTQAKPSIPVPPSSVLGVGFIDTLPDSVENSASLSLNTRQAEPTLAVSFQIEQPNDFEHNPVLVMSMDIGSHLRGCTGVGYSTSRDLAFEQLQPVSQAIVLQHWKAILSKENLGEAEVSESDIARRAQEPRYLEIHMQAETFKYRISRNGGAYRDVLAWKSERECQFETDSFWASDGPFFGLSIPRMSIGYLRGESYDKPAVQSSLQSKITDLGELSLTQSSTLPESSSDGSPTWKDSSASSYGQDLGKYRIKDARPVGVSFRSITIAQSDQEKVFWAGVGIGLAGSLLVMALPLMYDAIFVLTPAIRGTRKRASAESEDKLEDVDHRADEAATHIEAKDG